MDRKFRTTNRLRFEDGLTTGLRQPVHISWRIFTPRVSPVAIKALCLIAMLALAVAGARYIHIPSFSSRDAAIAPTCNAIINALRSGNADDAEKVLADKEPGLTQVREEDQKVSRTKAVQAAVRETAKKNALALPCADYLKEVRQHLQSAGVACDQIKPLAFGGVQAKVMDPKKMADWTSALTGELYFTAGDKVYALELTARKCRDTYFIVDFWTCNPVDVAPAQIADFAEKQYQTFKHEQDNGTTPIQMKSAKWMFVAL